MRGLRMLLGVAVIVALVYSLFNILPAYLTAYQFEDEMKEEAKLAVYSKLSEDQIHDVMMKKARELGVPVKSDQLIVKHVGDDLTISADYLVHVDIPSFAFDLKFHPTTTGHRLTGVV